MTEHTLDPVWMEVALYFVPEEFANPHAMDSSFIRKLYKMRITAGVPFRVTSSYRTPEHNERIKGASRSAHTLLPCRAVDLKVINNYERAQVVFAAIAYGIERLGIYPADENGAGVIHIDDSRQHPRPRIWTNY